MSNRRKTNNSAKEVKIELRKKVVEAIDKEFISVLDAFGGSGFLWKTMKLTEERKIEVLSIDKYNKKADIRGENLKVIPSLDLSRFDIIDLDSYGCPYNQIKAVVKNKTLANHTYIIYTYIVTGMGGANRDMLEEFGISRSMVKEAPTLFKEEQQKIFNGFLYKCGVKKVDEACISDNTSKKRYGYFVYPE